MAKENKQSTKKNSIISFFADVFNNPTLMGIIIGLLVFSIFSTLLITKTGEEHELNTLSWRFKSFSNSYKPSDNIIILGIGDSGMKRFGRWPWKRSIYGDLLKALEFYGVKSVSFDLFFPYKSDEDNDSTFVNGVKTFIQNGGNVIIGAVCTVIDIKDENNARPDKNILKQTQVNTSGKLNALTPKQILYLFKEKGNEELEYDESGDNVKEFFYIIQVPFKALFEATKSLGMVNIYSHGENEVYSVPLFIEYENIYIPTLSLATYLKTLDKYKISQGNNYIKINNQKVPVLNDNRYLVNWYQIPEKKEHLYPVVPVNELVDSYLYLSKLSQKTGKSKEELQQNFDLFFKCASTGKCSKEIKDKLAEFDKSLPAEIDGISAIATSTDRVKNKYAFIGVLDQSTGAKDFIRTPVKEIMQGVFLHAVVFDNFQHNHFIKKTTLNTTIIIMLILTLSTSITIIGIKNPYASVFAGLFYWLYPVIPILLFKYNCIYTDMLYTEGSIVLTSILAVIYQWKDTEKDKKIFKKTFSNYLSPQIMNELLSDPSKVDLGGEAQNVTILFSDIRGFTSLSEQRSPKEIVAILNEYFDYMVDAIIKNGGTVDKFIGDAIMAFWGAPVKTDNHPEMAIRGAIDMIKALETLKEKWKNEDKNYPEINIGIGINTGEAIVGNVGSSKIQSYTIIGDSVNLASRLEGLNKKYAINCKNEKCIIISEFTYEHVRDIFNFTDLGYEKVKGKDLAVKIYKVNGIKGEEEICSTTKTN